MFYENELRFLCEILKKNRIRVTFASPNDSIVNIIDDNFELLFIDEDKKSLKLTDVLGEIKPYIIHKFTNPFRLFYLFLSLPQTTTPTIMAIGPYLTSSVDNRQILEISEKYDISPNKLSLLNQYYASVPILLETDPIFTVIDTFAERIWGGAGSYTIIDSSNELYLPQSTLNKSNNDTGDDVLINMRVMEQRYMYENEIMAAVASGNDHKVAKYLSALSSLNFDKRTSDSIRNLKNYSIVMNTLLRKAAEQGGVHPLYLDEISSKFAVNIEQLSTIEKLENLMADMLKSYCRLVRKHTTNQYSSTVQKTISLIEYDLSSNLTLSSLATTQNISAGYLATIFKKETGMTVTEYIIDKRVALAMRLLQTTRLQVQTVALHCGIMDVQYFSKVFKKKTGMTPKAYRESVNHK